MKEPAVGWCSVCWQWAQAAITHTQHYRLTSCRYFFIASLQFEQMRVDIETVSPLAAGQTICDIWHTSKLPENCRVARQMDVDGFWDLMLAAVDAADAAAPMNKAAEAVAATLVAAAAEETLQG
eukprot:GHUV01029615.1.p1 GENE.GHUV01029615.1~~GHUV01029615.1.p1  ORF type:complete len:124 (+),score=42.87 GHUV01029615.1:461-832(+)